jgi:sarcosine/dimethylglycine N-methyltransferase
MSGDVEQAIGFYSRHPISLEIVLTRLAKQRGSLDGLQPQELWAHDQDHFGGLAANDALSKCAGIGPGARGSPTSAPASAAQRGITPSYSAPT